MDTISMMDEDPTLPIDFDQSTNILNFLHKDKMDSSGSRRESLLSPEDSSSEAVNKINLQEDDQNTPERGTLREHEEIIATFKKENFGLKLRIYFLEERLQMAYEEDTEDVLKTNIELKVNIEQLKNEVTEKQQLLIKASKAIETITTESEKHITKLKEEFTKQYDDMVNEMQQELESRDKELQEQEKAIENLNDTLIKAEKVKKELEDNLKSLNVNPQLVEDLKSKQKEEKYEKEIQEKDLKIKAFEEQMPSEEALKEMKELRDQVKERENKIQSLKDELRDLASQSPDKSNPHYEVLYNKLEAQNSENENKIKELSKELKKKSSLVEELKDYINKTDRVNKELRNSIHDKETEKHRSSISLQEHIRWKLNNRLRDLLASVRLDLALKNREKEVSRCNAQIEKLEELNSKLQNELSTKENVKEIGNKDGQEKLEAIAALKADLQEKEILFKKFKQAIEDKDKELLYFNNAKLKAEQELEHGISQKNIEMKAINEQLKKLIQANKDKMKMLEDQCQKMQEDSQLKLNNKDKLIQRLSNALRNKDVLIEELVAPQEAVDSGSETPQDSHSMVHIIKKLRAKLKDMDQTLEATLDEKFKSIDEKDKEILEMRRSTRDKDHELELAKANVIACEGVIEHLEKINGEKDKAMIDMRNALEIQQNSFQVSSEAAVKELEECQLNVLKLSRLLDVKEGEINELQNNFLKCGTDLDEGNLKAIHDQLDARHKLNQELASERDVAINRNEVNKQKFISALNSKDAQIRDAFLRMGRLSEEKNEAMKSLKGLVDKRNEELKLLEQQLSESRSEMEALGMRYQNNDNNKDQAIEKLAKSGSEKDRIIGELQERLNLIPKGSDNAMLQEMESLKEKLRRSDESLQVKSDEWSDLKLANKQLQEKLNDAKKSENIEITMKFDNLRSELEDKDRKLKDARDDVREIQREMKQAANLAESLQKKVRKLEDENDAQLSELEEVKRQCKKKDAAIKEMQQEVNDNRDLSETLQKLNEQRNKLEARLSALQAEMESLNSKKDALENKLNEADVATVRLEKKLEDSKNKNQSMACEIEDLKRENQELKSELERGSHIPKRDGKPVGAGIDEIDSKELRELLRAQIEEQKRLFEATEKEKSHFLKLIEELQNNSQSQKSSNLDLELQSISALKSQYEESVRQNDTLQHLLEGEIKSLRESTLKSSSSLPSPQSEIHNLKRKLEESENWNRSLQSRLDQLLPRAGGVGASIDSADGSKSAQIDNIEFEKLQKEHKAAVEKNLEEKKVSDLLRRQLGEKSNELEDTAKNLSDLKVHYDKFAQLRNKEIETLSNNCEQAKRVIKELEEKVTSLHRELQRFKESEGLSSRDLRKQIDGINGVNDVLRKTLNEKIEELKEATDKAANQDDRCKSLERISRSLSEEKNALISQLQEKSGQMTGMKTEIESLKLELENFKEVQIKKAKECDSLQQDRQELRNLNERLRKALGDVSKTYENLKEANEQDILSLKEELNMAQASVQRQGLENEQANAVNMRLRDEIKSLQESSREVQRLADELRNSEGINKALQKQLNELAESSEMRRHDLEPEVDRLKRRVKELLQSNSHFEEKFEFYERQAAALQAEYRRERSAFENEKEALCNEIEILKQEIVEVTEIKADLESKAKQLFYQSETYKSMIERLEEDNVTKQNAIDQLETELHRQRNMMDHSTAMTPQKRSSMTSQTTPNRLLTELEGMQSRENTLKEALQKRDNYIEALKKQLEFYKEEKGHSEIEKKRHKEEDSNNNNNLIALHIAEMRELRKELEQSINNNNALRDHLEHRLSEAEKEAEKLKDPNVRVTLLRENDNLRAKIAEHDVKIKELQFLNERLRQDHQRSSGLVLEKDNQIKQLQIKLEKKNMEFERMQMFAPQETSSTVTSPIQSFTNFTQTTPRKQILKIHKEIQVDTVVAKALAERQKLGEKVNSLEMKLKEKERAIENVKQEHETEKDETFRSIVNMKSEIVELKAMLENKNLLINSLEAKINELEETISAKDVETQSGFEKKTANDDLIALHISEMQKLKKELELSIKNNEELKTQLEHRLSMIEKDAEKIKDPKLRVNIIRDNDLLRSQSIERQNAVARLQSVIDQLVAEKKNDKECIKKLHQQVHNLNKVITILKEEVSLYDRLQQQLSESTARNQAKSKSPELESTISKNADALPKFDASLLQILLEEIRNLRVQLQKSIDTNIALKEKLEEQLGTSFNTSGFSSPANTAADSKQALDEAKENTVRRALFSSLGVNDTQSMDVPGNLRHRLLTQETPTKENSSPNSRSYFLSPNSLAAVVDGANNKNLFVRGRLEDFVLLKNKLASCCQRVVAMQNVQSMLQKQRQVTGKQMNELTEEVDKIALDLKQCRKLIDLMWIDDNNKKEETADSSTVLENQQLKTEIASLKKRLMSQEKLIKTSLQRLEESNKLKGDLEQQILTKLKTTHGTMIKASQNLEDKIVKSKTPPKSSRKSLGESEIFKTKSQ